MPPPMISELTMIVELTQNTGTLLFTLVFLIFPMPPALLTPTPFSPLLNVQHIQQYSPCICVC